MAALPRRAPFLLLRCALAAAAVAAVAAPAAAQVEEVEGIDWAFTLHQAKGGNLWDITALTAPAGDVVALFYDSEGATAQHNVVVTEPSGIATPASTSILDPDSGKVYVTLTMPKQGTVTYICAVHPKEMIGKITVGAFTSGGGGATGVQVNSLGVHFLAHWVGVISFAVLFLLYIITFFLFKYNETSATTDHLDRPEGAVDAAAYGEPFLTTRNVVTFTVFLVAAGAIVLALMLESGSTLPLFVAIAAIEAAVILYLVSAGKATA